MGAVHFSLDEGLIEELQRLLPLQVLVETGTFQGETLALARPRFERVYSVEIVAEQHRRAAERFAGDDGVVLRCGDSPAFLRELRSELADRSVLYWLDAHWCGGNGMPAPGADQCPLLRELAAIEVLGEQSVILIDDARYFLAPPPAPNDAGQWPRFDEVVDGLRDLAASHEILVFNDVIVFHPRAVRDGLRAFAAQCGVDLAALVALAAAGQRARDETAIAQRDAAPLERLCAELRAVAAERLELLENLHRECTRLTARCAELETAAAERLTLLQGASEQRLRAEQRCAELETAAAERLALLQGVSEQRLRAEQRCAELETAAAERLALLQGAAEQRLQAERRCAEFETAAVERLALLQRAAEQWLQAEQRCADFETAAVERLALLQEVAAEQLRMEQRCAEFERAAAERLDLLHRVVGERAEVDRRLADVEQAAEQRLRLLEEVSAGKAELEQAVSRFETALALRDRRVFDLERALDQRGAEIGAARSRRSD